jgi:hypothetical protein
MEFNSEFVTRKGTDLLLDGNPFKFCSFNIPNYQIIEIPWSRVIPSEQLDLVSTINQMGAKVFRIYTFSIPKVPSDISKHIIVTGGYGTESVKWSLNENLFLDFDSGLKIASEFGVKLIIPMIDNFEWWGGIGSFSAMYGKTTEDFYSNQVVIDGWKQFISLILLRKNTFTGILYKDDPTIMAWETGNELQFKKGSLPDSWSLPISSYIKSIDDNHLLIDGSYGINGWSDNLLNHPAIDIYSNHFYPQPLGAPVMTLFTGFDIGLISTLSVLILVIGGFMFFQRGKKKSTIHSGLLISTIAIVFIGLTYFFTERMINQNYGIRMEYDLNRVSSFRKAYMVGEVGISSHATMKSLFDKFPTSDAVGMLVWSLRGHARNGGFYIHEEHSGYYAYHYPGFPDSQGFGRDELDVMGLIDLTLLKMGVIKNNTIPAAPFLVDDLSGNMVRWQGSAGASNYTIEILDPIKAVIGTGITDNKPAGQGLFQLNLDIIKYKNITLRVSAFGEYGIVTSQPKKLIFS